MEDGDHQVATVFDRRLMMRPEDKDASLYELLRGWVADCPSTEFPVHDSCAGPPARFLKFGDERGGWQAPTVKELSLNSGGRRRQDKSIEELRAENMARFQVAADKVQRRRAKNYEKCKPMLDRLCIPRHRFLETVLGNIQAETANIGTSKRGRQDGVQGVAMDVEEVSGVAKRSRVS